MDPDRLRDLAAIERELRSERDRPAVWEGVVHGQVDPSAAAQERARDDSPAQLTIDQELFRPLPAAQRERLLNLMLAESTQPAAIVPLRRRLFRSVAVGGGLAAAAGVLLLIARAPTDAIDDPVSAFPSNVSYSVEIIGGMTGDRGGNLPEGTPGLPTVAPGLPTVALDRGFRIQVRIKDRTFGLHKLFVHCAGHDSELSFTPLQQQSGLVEADVRPPQFSGGLCNIEVQVVEGSKVFRLPELPERRVKFADPQP